MSGRRTTLRHVGRIGPLFALAGVAGFLLGACGGGGGGAAQATGLTGTRTGVTVGRLRVAHVGGDPVEGGERDDGIELRALRLPALEVRVDHLDAREVRQLALRDGGEVL